MRGGFGEGEVMCAKQRCVRQGSFAWEVTIGYLADALSDRASFLWTIKITSACGVLVLVLFCFL